MTDETIRVLDESLGYVISPGERWVPHVGEKTFRFLNSIPDEMRRKVEGEAYAVLSHATEPGEPVRRAGLVLGCVQSGKTTSFTAAATLAGDNGYAMVIVLGGTSKPLLAQTRNRLVRDLDLRASDAYRHWIRVDDPKSGSDEAETLRSALTDFLNEDDPDDKVPVLITIMKQHRHMNNLADVLREIGEELPLNRLTALIVDDEADQATPNIREEDEESTTYARLKAIRRNLPSHTLLQYTATPQATLLVSIADEISPDFVCVLEPGEGYTGGIEFFVNRRETFVNEIPLSELDAADPDVDVLVPPMSLRIAFATYVLGAAIADLRDRNAPQQISMMVHPSKERFPHARYRNWLETMCQLWMETLGLDESDADRSDLIRDELALAYQNPCRSVTNPPELDHLLIRTPRILQKISFRTIQGGGGSDLEFQNGRYWVLIGGQLLDRGYTVEGLTVTYMPRSIGVGNADTLQQRARFFGYKSQYADICRAWLAPNVADAFAQYVNHEEKFRSELRQVAASGQSLKEWRRVFFLSPQLRLTRQNVIRLQLHDSLSRVEWFEQRYFPDGDTDFVESDRGLVKSFVASNTFVYEPLSGPQESQQHSVATLNLRDALDTLLADFVMAEAESPEFTAVLLMLEEAASTENEECKVIRMASGMNALRMRSTHGDSGRIKQLMQGQNPKSGSGPITYEGDRKIYYDAYVTVQIHQLNLTVDDGTDDGTNPWINNAPVLAIRVPERLRQRVLLQVQS
jgi:Z1 domain